VNGHWNSSCADDFNKNDLFLIEWSKIAADVLMSTEFDRSQTRNREDEVEIQHEIEVLSMIEKLTDSTSFSSSEATQFLLATLHLHLAVFHDGF
jgi:hypothetical protein